MADLKLVGAVAIKLRPDAKGFKREAEALLKKEQPDVKVKMQVEGDTSQLDKDVAEAKEEIEKGKQISLKVGLDYDSVRRAQAQLDKALLGSETIEVKLDDKGSIAEAQARLAELMDSVEVDMKFIPDERGAQAILDKIAEIRRQKLAVEVDFHTDDANLDRLEEQMRAFLHESIENDAKVEVSYNNDELSIRRAMAQVEAELDKLKAIKFDVNLDEESLDTAKAILEAELARQTVKIEYDDNLPSLLAAKARIEALLGIEKLNIETKLDEDSLTEALAKINTMIEAAEARDVKPKIKPEISQADYFKTWAALRLLTRNQTVGIFVQLNNASILAAAAKLTGLRAAGRWSEELARSLGTLDRNLPIVAAVTLGLNALSAGVISLTASAFSLGNGLGQVVRSAGLLAPALLLGYAAVQTVFTGVFKDFGAAVNGDTKAIEKLTESGKKAAANIRVYFQDIREVVSQDFWKAAGDSMLRFTETALPQVRDGLSDLATSMGGVFSRVLDAFSQFSEQNGISTFFANLTRGFDIAQTGMASFMSAFLTLASVGSTVFPRMGAAFEAFAGKFDSWVQRLAADGTLSRWIDLGVQGMKDMFNTGVNLTKVWANIGDAAQGAGAMTLSSLAAVTAKMAEVTSGNRFQTNLGNIFDGARAASDSLHEALSEMGPAMDTFTVTVKNGLTNAGAAFAAFLGGVQDILSSKNLDTGLTAFLSGLKDMFVELRPAAAPITEILKTFGQVLGAVATDSGPLFRNLFEQLASVLTVAWKALQPFLPELIQIGTSIVNILGPALSSMAGDLIPAFASGLVDIGDGLVPIIKGIADFATGAAVLISQLPAPVVIGIATAILSLGTAFQVAATMVPLATGALEAFGIMSTLTGIRMQLMIPVVGLVLAALSGLALGGVAALATAQSNATPYANDYERALREDAEAAGALANAVGEATTALTIDKLVKSGAYDQAKKLGITTRELTEAIIKGGPAMENIMGKLNGVTGAYEEQALAAIGTQGEVGHVSEEMLDQTITAEKLKKNLDEVTGSLDAGRHANELRAEASKAAGIKTQEQIKFEKEFEEQLGKTSARLGEASAASRILTDEFASSTSQIDAMRKTFDILVGKPAGQAAAESLGMYVKGFNDLKESVAPIAQDLRNLGDAAYGENGFLNVASGNKAVLQVNQALVDQVNNVWAGAKAAYDSAIDQGKTAADAFVAAQKFIGDHKAEYDELATASGLSAEQVQGQWDAVFGKEWVLKVSLSGATEAATKAQEMITLLKGQWDGAEYQAFMDANPDKALLQISNPVAAAQAFVDKTWMAELDALPDAAQDKIRELVGQTEEEWDKGDFMATLYAANNVPGLADVLLQIRNGASNNGQDWQSILYAALNGVSVETARATLDALANTPRTAYIQSVILPPNSGADGMDLFLAQNGGGGSRFGSILDQFGRGIAGFNAERIKFFANGGIENHVAQITRAGGPVRVWAEKETQGEAYLPLAASKRPRSVQILKEVARRFGYEVTRSGTHYANGGISAPSPVHNQADVHIGTLVTTDMDAAVRKLNQSRRDAMAVAGLRP